MCWWRATRARTALDGGLSAGPIFCRDNPRFLVPGRYRIFQGAEGPLRIVLAAFLVVASIRRINGSQPLTSPLPLMGLLGLPPC